MQSKDHQFSQFNPSPFRIHLDTIEEIQQRADIVEVIGKYVALRKRGKEFVGLCPFHDEKTPSFSVSPSNQLYYCFGCGNGGNAIKFLMEVGQRSFREVVLELTAHYGVQVKGKDGNPIRDYHALPFPVSQKRQSVLAESHVLAESKQPPKKDYTVDARYVERSKERLLKHLQEPQQKALEWLINHRGFSGEMIEHFPLGLERISANANPDEKQPPIWKHYWGVGIFIPVPSQPGRFYRKVRVAPWLNGTQRPDYLRPWYQMGVPTTVWAAYNPQDADETWFCEGEWDALRLGWSARQRQEKVAVACSTGGCGTLPKLEQLEVLPGEITIFYDCNDNPDKNGLRPGDEGAKKLAIALSGRGKIGSVPMATDCDAKGWDVSNALDVGFTWSDFKAAASAAAPTPATEDGGSNPPIGNGGGRWGSRGFGGGAGNGGRGDSPLSEVSLSQRIDEILDRNLDESAQEVAFFSLAKQCAATNREIQEIAEKRFSERESGDNRFERRNEIDNIERWEQSKVNLERLFYRQPEVAAALKHLCRVRCLRPEYFLGILPIIAMLSGTGTSLRIAQDFIVPTVVNIGLVGESSDRKSVVASLLMKPLRRIEAEIFELHKQQKARFDSAVAAWEALNPKTRGPKPREDEFITVSKAPFIVTEETREGLVKAHLNQPSGLLLFKAELASVSKGFNVYRGGRGDDEEFFNNLWDADPITRVLASQEVLRIAKTCVPQLGGIQPDVLLSLMDLDDPNGRWARYLWILCPLEKRRTSFLDSVVDVGPMLYDLYSRARKAPKLEHIPSREALEFFDQQNQKYEELQYTNPRAGMRALYGKIPGMIARIALNLHRLNAAAAGVDPELEIPLVAFVVAVELIEFFLAQLKVIRAAGEANVAHEHSLGGVYREIKRLYTRVANGRTDFVLTARDVLAAHLRVFKGKNAKDVVKVFKDMQEIGLGFLKQAKRSLGLVIASVLSDGDGGSDSGNGPKTPPTPPDTPPINNDIELIAENAEDLLKKDESPEANISNDFESSAELLKKLTNNFGSSSQSDLNVSANIVETIDETLVESSSAVDLESSAEHKQNPETISPASQPVTPIGATTKLSKVGQVSNYDYSTTHHDHPTHGCPTLGKFPLGAELPQSLGVGFGPVAPMISASASAEVSNDLEATQKTYAVYAALGKYSSKSWILDCTLASSPSTKGGHWEFLTAIGKRIRIYVEKDFRLEVKSLPSQPQQPLPSSVQEKTEAAPVVDPHVARLAEQCRQMMQNMREINGQFGCA